MPLEFAEYDPAWPGGPPQPQRLIQELAGNARAERGLPSVPVWEE